MDRFIPTAPEPASTPLHRESFNCMVQGAVPSGREIDDDENKGSVRVVSGSGFRYVVPFPWRLHQMLDDIEKAGDDAVVSWLPDGRHFQVHNPQVFMQRIIPKFFKQKSYKSFQRQLHLYGFQRVLEGRNRGAYFHENFVQENRKLSLEITRVKAPRRRRITKTQQKVEAQQQQQQQQGPPTLGPLARFTPTAPFVDEVQETDVTVGQGSSSNDDRTLTSVNIRPQESHPCDRVDSATTTSSEDRLTYVCGSATPNATAITTSNAGSAANASELPPESSVAETYEWLINAGVPFSSFDPVSIESSPRPRLDGGKEGIAPDLFECAEEITSLFSFPSPQI